MKHVDSDLTVKASEPMAATAGSPLPGFRFLDTIELLDGRTLEGDADRRGSEDALLGGVRLWGLRLIEVSPGSAWMSAYVATRCGEYTALDRPATAGGSPDGVRGGWLHVMQTLGLHPTIIAESGFGEEQPGGYDVALLFGALSRATDPLALFETAAALSDDMLIVIEPAGGIDAGSIDEPAMTMLPPTDDPYSARWTLSPVLLEHLLAQAGFDQQVSTRHGNPANKGQAAHVTIVARRPIRRAARLRPAAARAETDAPPRQAAVEEHSPDLEAAMDLPFPPPADRRAVAGTPDVEVFVAVGRSVFARMVQTLGRNGIAAQQLGRVLDLGCGVSRILRWWRMFPVVEVHGTDIDVAAVTWNRERLGYGTFTINTLDPRLDYPPASFALVYAIDVMTHLPEHLQTAWFREAVRIMQPGGHLYVTTRGRSCRALLPPDLQAVFDADKLVTGGAEQAGTNECVAFHPPQWILNTVLPATGMDLVEVAESPAETPGEDCWLLRKPQSA